MEIRSKSELAIVLSELKTFENGKVRLEQYPTDSEVGADILWNAGFNDIWEKVIVDLGCGTGILGIGALLMGAERVIFIDIDDKVLDVLRENIHFIDDKMGLNLNEKSEIICKNVNDLSTIKSDLVVQNPPFGVKLKHADRMFLEKAFSIAPIVYSLHKVESKGFIEAFSKDSGFKITHYWEYDFPLKQTMKFHKRRIQKIKVGCWRLEKRKPSKIKISDTYINKS